MSRERRGGRREPRHGRAAAGRAPVHAHPAPPGPRRAAVPAWLWGVLGLALLLRAWHLGHGLPDFLDEALPLRRALEMWDWSSGAIDWNPHRFHYPSLTFYLHLLLQRAVAAAGTAAGVFTGLPDYVLSAWADPAWLALPGRGLSVAFDVWTVWSVARIGERLRPGSGWLAGTLAACAATSILAARLIYTDTVMTAFAMAAFERLLAWRAHGGRARFTAAVALLGLACGAKYPAVALLVPFALVIVAREGARGVPRVAAAAAGVAAVFLLTTPYAVLDAPQFLTDIGFLRRMGAEGHFGNYERAGFLFHLRHLVRDLGWGGPVALAGALSLAAAAARRWRERPEPTAVALGLLVMGVPIALARVEAERYLVTVLPFAALLCAWAAGEAAARAPERLRRPLAVVLAAALVTPALWGGVRAGAALDDATRIEARAWCEAHLGRDDVVVQEMYGAPLLERSRVAATHAGRVYALASPRARAAYDARAAFRTVTLPLTVVGARSLPVAAPGGAPVEVDLVARTADVNAPLYDPRLFRGVDVFVTTGAVRGRFEADPAGYAGPLRFYALLDSTAERLARFEPRGGRHGPTITVYRFTARTRAAIDALGPLPPLWWVGALDPSARGRIEEVLLPPERRGVEPLLGADGEPATWVRALAGMFEDRYLQYPLPMAKELTDAGRTDAARPLVRAVLAMAPARTDLAVPYAQACAARGEWAEAAAVLRHAAASTTAPGLAARLRLALAEMLARGGDAAGARAEYLALRGAPDAQVAAMAAQRLQALGTGR